MGWGTHDTFYCVDGIMRRRDCMNRTEAAGWNKVCTSVDKQNHFFNIWDSKSQRFRNVPASGPLCCAANVRRSWFLSRDAATKNRERNFPNQKTLSKRQLTVQLQIFPEHFWTGCSLRMQKGDHGFFFFIFFWNRGGARREQTAGGSSAHNNHSWRFRGSRWDLLAASLGEIEEVTNILHWRQFSCKYFHLSWSKPALCLIVTCMCVP